MKRNISFVQIFSTIALFMMLSGCVKVQLGIEVNPNGSGKWNMALGMTEQMITYLALQGTNFIEAFETTYAEKEGADSGKVNSWSDDGYQWVEVSQEFKSVSELSDEMNDLEMFENFSLVKTNQSIKTKFILNARFNPKDSLSDTDDSTTEENLYSIDPNAFFDFDFSANLPGSVVNTNGVLNEETNTIHWKIASDSPTEVYAETEILNWLNIGLIAGVLLIMLVLSLIGLFLIVRNFDLIFGRQS